MLKQLHDCYALLDARAKGQYALLGLMMLVAAGLETLSVGLILPFLQLIENPAQAAAAVASRPPEETSRTVVSISKPPPDSTTWCVSRCKVRPAAARAMTSPSSTRQS